MKELKEKGFTLIELLAIIIILGIIAVIAVPIVKKLTDEAKLKAFENTARGIIKAGDLYYSRKDMMDDINGNMVFTFPDNAEELELQGKLPENGTMIINEDGDIALAISNKKYCITKGINAKDISITENYETCNIPHPYMSSTNACVTSRICTQEEIIAGIKVNVKVNEVKNYDFYVIADNGTELTLLMDRNLGDNVKWYSQAADTSKGPVTAVGELKTRTNDWINIAEKEYRYSDDGGGNKYDAFTQIMRARMMSYTEASVIVTANNNKMPSWMYVNLYNTGSDTDSLGNNKHGYWTSTAFGGELDTVHVYDVAFDGYFDNSDFTNYNTNGIRPVITIEK